MSKKPEVTLTLPEGVVKSVSAFMSRFKLDKYLDDAPAAAPAVKISVRTPAQRHYDASLVHMGSLLLTASDTHKPLGSWELTDATGLPFSLIEQGAKAEPLFHRVNSGVTEFLVVMLAEEADLRELNAPPSFVLKGQLDGRIHQLAVWQFANPVDAGRQPFTATIGLTEISRALKFEGQPVRVLLPTYLPVAGIKVGEKLTEFQSLAGTYSVRGLTDLLGITEKLRQLSAQAQQVAVQPTANAGDVGSIVKGFFAPGQTPALFDAKPLYVALGQRLKAGGYDDPQAVAVQVVAALAELDGDWILARSDLTKVIPLLAHGMGQS